MNGSRVGAVPGADWVVSRHAQNAALRRGVSLSEITEVIGDAEVVYDQRSYGEWRQIRQRGKIAIAVDLRDRVVITVLLRHHDTWTDQDCRLRDGHLLTAA